MSRTKRWLAEAVAAIAVCCMILSCLAVSEQSSFGIVDPPGAGNAPVCANNPVCRYSGEEPDRICGNANGGTSGGGNCDPLRAECVCVPHTVRGCICSN